MYSVSNYEYGVVGGLDPGPGTDFSAYAYEKIAFTTPLYQSDCGPGNPYYQAAAPIDNGNVVLSGGPTSWQVVAYPAAVGAYVGWAIGNVNGYCIIQPGFHAYQLGVKGQAPGNAIPRPDCPLCNTSTGDPVDATTGSLWEEKTDLALPGPYGLKFTRFYGSNMPDTGDIGYHWSHNFSEHVFIPPPNTSSAASAISRRMFGKPGSIPAARRMDSSGGVTALSDSAVYFDAQEMPHYFGPTGGYDSISHLTLTVNPDGVTSSVTTFDGKKMNFDAFGDVIQTTDRIGNTQTISRDPSTENINYVQDSIGRKLCFYYYDGRIIGVGAWFQYSACPSSLSSTSPAVSFSYDNGTDPAGNVDCYPDNLCGVTEPDGHTWTFGYDDSTGDAHNLTAIYDPLGNPEELNTFANDQVVAQHRGGSDATGGNLVFSYIQGLPNQASDPLGHTQITNPQTGETSDFYFDANANIVQKSGFLCDCEGYQGVTYTYDAFDRITSQADQGNAIAGTGHLITYAYGRDANDQTYPGPTSVTEVLDSIGTTRTELIAYYPIGDPRQDLERTVQDPSVDTLGAYHTTTLTFSPQGLLTESDETGYVNGSPVTHSTKMTYDTRGRPSSAVMPRRDLNATTTFAYFADSDTDLDRAGLLSSVTDALGHRSTFASVAGFTSYSPYGQPLSVNDSNGVGTTFTYDAWGRQTSKTLDGVSNDATSLVDSNAYDAAGRLASSTRPLGNSEIFGFDSADRLITTTLSDSGGAYHDRLAVSYNSSDEVVSRSAQSCAQPSSSCTAWTTTTSTGYQYDTFGEPVKVLDAAAPDVGAAVTQTLTSDSQEIAYTNQGVPAAAFDENHAAESDLYGPSTVGLNGISVSPSALLTNYGWTYDYAGRKLTAQRFLPLGSADPPTTDALTSFTYDKADNITSQTDPNGNLTYYHYDDFGNLLTESSPVSGQTTYTYDFDRNLLTSHEPTGAVTSYTYDALDRPIRSVSTKPTMPTETVAWNYDDVTPGNFGIGRLSSMSDPAGTTNYTYERRGLITSVRRVIDGYAFTEKYAYDGNGNRQAMTYPDGLSLGYTYDWADRPYSVWEITPSSLAADAREHAHSLESMPNRSRRHISQMHNPLPNELFATKAMAPVVRPHLPIERPKFAYAGLKRVPVSLHALEHIDNQEQRALQLLTHVGKLSATIPILSRTGNRRDTANVSTMLVIGTAYAPFGPMIARSFGNGTVQTMMLDQRYRVTQNLLVNSANQSLANLQYADDADGNIITISDVLNPQFSKLFAYDDMNRLVASITGPAASTAGALTQNAPSPSPAPTSGIGLWGSALYDYDRMGNTTAEQVGARVSKFSYSGTTSKLSSVISTTSTTGSVSYDAGGNETAVGLNSYQYSARNELVSAMGPEYASITLPGVGLGAASTPSTGLGTPWTYRYDGFGTRLVTNANQVAPAIGINPIHVGLSSQATRYSIPGPDGMLATETSINRTGVPAYDYIWMGDAPVAQLDGMGTHYTFADHLNAPTIQTGSTGAITYQADYEPYGSIYDLRGTANPHQPLRLPGQIAEQFDTSTNGATDLSYNNARWYRPAWGRFTQTDVVTPGAGGNEYSYVDEAPTGPYVDPSGLCKVIVHRKQIFNDGLRPYYHLEIETYDEDSNTSRFWIGGSTEMNAGNLGPATGIEAKAMVAADVLPSESIKYRLAWMAGLGNISPWGDLYVYDDRNRKKHAHYWDHPTGGTVVRDTGCKSSCHDLNLKLQDYENGLNHLHLPYDPLYVNSNVAAIAILLKAGVDQATIDSVTVDAPNGL